MGALCRAEVSKQAGRLGAAALRRARFEQSGSPAGFTGWLRRLVSLLAARLRIASSRDDERVLAVGEVVRRTETRKPGTSDLVRAHSPVPGSACPTRHQPFELGPNRSAGPCSGPDFCGGTDEDLIHARARRTPQQSHHPIELPFTGEYPLRPRRWIDEHSPSVQDSGALECERRRYFTMEMRDGEIDDDPPQQRIRIPHGPGPLVIEEAQVRFLHQILGIVTGVTAPPAHPDELRIPRRKPTHRWAALLPLGSTGARILSG